MSWYPDLSAETLITWGDDVRAIGWLSGGHSFPQGECFGYLALRGRYQTTLCVLPPTATTSGVPSPSRSPPRRSWAAISRSSTVFFHEFFARSKSYMDTR